MAREYRLRHLRQEYGALFITYSIDRNGLPSVEENCI